MKYFTQDFYDFFIELSANNNKDWFDLNRKRYHESVKTPFDQFIAKVIEEVSSFDNTIQISYSDAIFRINRDIRFAKDKTPYKLDRSAIISATGRKNKSIPGLYLNLNPNKFSIFAGAYRLDAKQIHSVREEILDYSDSFIDLINEPNLVTTFGDVLGEKSKRLPKEFQEKAESLPWLWNKGWYLMTEFSPETIFQDNVIELVAAHYQVAKPLCDFLKRPIMVESL